MPTITETLSDEFVSAAERAFLKKVPEGCIDADDPEYIERYERANVIRVLSRLELLQKTVSQHVGEPIIYHWPFLSVIGVLKFSHVQHINAGIINDPELLLDDKRWVGIGTQEALFSTKVNGNLEQGYAGASGMSSFQIDNLLHFHINGDTNEGMGFMVGSKVVGQFLEAIDPGQTDFIKQNLGMS